MHMPTLDDEYPWGVEGPPGEAYSRVTRDLATLYAPLAPAAEGTVRRLVSEYEVTANDVLDSEQELLSRVIKAVALIPDDARMSSLTIAWTDLPGLTVRLDDGVSYAVPPCGCDACAESLAQCLDLFATEVDRAERTWNGIRRVA